MGFEIEASHHEVAAGQHEIDFRYADALTAADDIMTFKFAVKSIAQKNGLHATFMPKPVFGVNGSGMHTNMSLFRDGKNAFYDESDPRRLSRAAYSFIAGLLRHVKGHGRRHQSARQLLQAARARLRSAPATSRGRRANRSALIRIPRRARGGDPRGAALPGRLLQPLSGAGRLPRRRLGRHREGG